MVRIETKAARERPETRFCGLRQRSLMCSEVIQPNRKTPPTATQPCRRKSHGSAGFGAGPSSVAVGKNKCTTSQAQPLNHNAVQMMFLRRRWEAYLALDPLLPPLLAAGAVPPPERSYTPHWATSQPTP